MVRSQNFKLLVIISFFFFVINYLLQLLIYSTFNYNSLSNIIHINKSSFWFSSPGIGLKAMIEMSIVSALIYSCSLLMPQQIAFRAFSKSISFAYLIFLFQMIVEAVLINTNLVKITNSELAEFSFLSIFYFSKILGFTIIPAFHYLAQVISLFEILFWILLVFNIAEFAKIRLLSSILLVGVGYILPLFIWLFCISFIVLING